MLMLVGLLLAGPLAQISAFAAGAENNPELGQAKADNAAAAKMLSGWMTQMDSMMKMPMTANEKAMAKMMMDMGKLVKMLIDENNKLIIAIGQR